MVRRCVGEVFVRGFEYASPLFWGVRFLIRGAPEISDFRGFRCVAIEFWVERWGVANVRGVLLSLFRGWETN